MRYSCRGVDGGDDHVGSGILVIMRKAIQEYDQKSGNRKEVHDPWVFTTALINKMQGVVEEGGDAADDGTGDQSHGNPFAEGMQIMRSFFRDLGHVRCDGIHHMIYWIFIFVWGLHSGIDPSFLC